MWWYISYVRRRQSGTNRFFGNLVYITELRKLCKNTVQKRDKTTDSNIYYSISNKHMLLFSSKVKTNLDFCYDFMTHQRFVVSSTNLYTFAKSTQQGFLVNYCTFFASPKQKGFHRRILFKHFHNRWEQKSIKTIFLSY